MRLTPALCHPHLAKRCSLVWWGLLVAWLTITLPCSGQEPINEASGDVAFESELGSTAQETPEAKPPQAVDAQLDTGPAEAPPQQPTPSDPATMPPPAGPDTTIWIDDEGQPRPIIGMTYEELQRAWRMLRDLEQPSEGPQFVREKITLTGKVADYRYEFKLRCTVRLPGGGRVAVPLGLASAILTAAPRIDGAAADQSATAGQFVLYDQSRGGYVVWLEGKPGDAREVELTLIAPLERDGDRTLFRTNLPRASQSEVLVETAKSITEPFASPGSHLVSTATPGGVRLMVQGGVGEFQLGWREAATNVSRQPNTLLSVEGQVLVDIDGRHVRSEATLKLQSYGGPLERFRVRLPQGATLIPPRINADGDDQPRFTPIAEDPAEILDSGPLWLVTLPQPISEPATVKVVTDQLLGLDDQAEFDLAGFEVPDAVRQYGDVAIRVADDWRLRWGDVNQSRRIDIGLLPAELQRPGLTDALRYFRQGWSGQVQIELISKRIEASPRYRLEILPDRAVLKTTVAYRIRGARVSGFTIDLRDWTDTTADAIEPVRLVDEAQSDQSIDGKLYVALKEPATRHAEISFTATRDLSPRDETLSFRLPIAEANSLGASEMIVVVDPSLRLIPDPTRSRRLRAATLRPEDKDPADPTGLRTFRFRGFLPDQRFVAEKLRRPGELDVAIESRLTLNETDTEVVQDFHFDARYEAVDRVRLTAPRDLLREDDLRLELLPTETTTAPDGILEGELSDRLPLTYEVIEEASLVSSEAAKSGVDPSHAAIEITLPRPWLGLFTVRAVYRAPGGVREIDTRDSTAIELLTAHETTHATHKALALAPSGALLTLDQASQGWIAAEPSSNQRTEAAGSASPATNSQATLHVQTEFPAERLVIAASSSETPQSAGATVRQAWWQTWTGADKRQQRAVFRFDTTDSSVVAELPLTAANQQVEVLLDDALYPRAERVGNRLTIRLEKRASSPESAGNLTPSSATHTLELRYFEPKRRGRASEQEGTAVAWRPARLVADDALAQSYWQVILPATQHVVDPPTGFATAMRWGFNEGVWGRWPQRTSAELEAWIDAQSRGDVSVGEHSYLYSFYGSPPPEASRALATVSRQTAVLVCSVGLLAFGLALIYVPALRRPAYLLTMILVLAAVGVLYPGPFLLVAQAGAIGLVLAALAAILATVMSFPTTRETRLSSAELMSGESLSLVDVAAGGTDTMITLPMGSVSTNAPTVSVPPQESNG